MRKNLYGAVVKKPNIAKVHKFIHNPIRTTAPAMSPTVKTSLPSSGHQSFPFIAMDCQVSAVTCCESCDSQLIAMTPESANRPNHRPNWASLASASSSKFLSRNGKVSENRLLRIQLMILQLNRVLAAVEVRAKYNRAKCSGL